MRFWHQVHLFQADWASGLMAAVGNSGRTDCADSDSDAVSWTFPHYFIVRSRKLLCVRFHFAYLYVSVWIKVNSSVSSHIQTHSGCGLTPEIFSLHLQRRVNREKGEKKDGRVWDGPRQEVEAQFTFSRTERRRRDRVDDLTDNRKETT